MTSTTTSGDQRNALPIGHEFDGYRIDAVLGAGGFGVTYRATELSINRTVAIKEFLPAGMAWRDSRDHSVHAISDLDTQTLEWGRKSFQREAETLVNFRHPNVVSVLRFFEANQTAYMVMDYEDGESLGNILRDTGALDQEELEEILHPLLDALEEVHTQGFLHRDIKPANIYIRRNGSPVLLDFGAAKQNLSERSHSLNVVLTPPFAPMEQYSSSEPLGPWTDIYALGMTFYVCATNNEPPDAMARSNAVMGGRNDPIRPPQEALGKGFTAQFKEAVSYATRLLQEDRPQTVDEWRRCFASGQAPEATRVLGAVEGAAARRAQAAIAGRPARGRGPWPWLASGLGVLAIGGLAYGGYMHMEGDGQSAELVSLRTKLTTMQTRHSDATKRLASTQDRLGNLSKANATRLEEIRRTAVEAVAYGEKYRANRDRADQLEKAGSKKYFDEKDHRAAYPLLLSAANLGHPRAQMVVAYMTLRGIGTPKDEKAAFRWYLRSAEGGDRTAMTTLAHLYTTGQGGRKDPALAFIWAARATLQNSVRGYCHLGSFYMRGFGVDADPKTGVRYFTIGAQKRDPWCMYELGIAYENGKGVTRNRARAVGWYRRAANANYGPARAALRRLQ